MLSESQILELLVEKTNPTVLEMTEEETQQWADIEEFKIRSEKDRQEVSEKLFKIRREEELLRMARGEAAASS
jgi:large subunit ribosomal protein MRP49